MNDWNPGKSARAIAFVISMLLVTVVAGVTSPARAQDAVANGERAAETAAPPAPVATKSVDIPVDQIGVESEKAKYRIAETLEALKTEPAIAAFSEAIPAHAESVDALAASSRQLMERDASLVEVDQLRQEWDALLADLDAMQVGFGARSADISRVREMLTKQREVWTATDAAAEEAGEEESLQLQIEDVLSQLTSALEVAKGRQGEIASLQSQVAGLSEVGRAELAKLADIRRTLVGRVFERDRIPMTSPEFFAHLDPDDIEARLIEHWDREVAGLARFAERYRDRLLLHAVATFALILLTFSARRRIHEIHDAQSDDDPELDHMEEVFQQPIALALLLSLFVGLWGYAEIPPLAAPVVGATALLPAVLILRRLVAPPIRPVLYTLLALYFVDRLNTTIAPLPGLPRLVFIGEMIAMFVLVMWWRQPSRLKDVPRLRRETVVFRWLALGLRIALIAMPSAIVAELAGYTALARLLGSTVLTAGYAGVMLYGSVTAADGFVSFLLHTRPLDLSGMVQRHRSVIAQNVQRVVRWVALLLFAWVILNRLEIVHAVWGTIVAAWELSIPLIAVDITLGAIVEFLIIVRLTFLLSRFIQFALDEEVYTRVRMRKGQPYAVSTLTHYVVLLVGFLLAVFALGVDVNRFTLLAGAFGVGIGFGLQTVVNNFVSGIILLTEQPVQVGDTIELEGAFGEVQRIGIRSSTVRTWQGAEVIVPNAQLVSEQVTNWTLSDEKRRIEVPVGVAYGSDPTQVIALIERVASAHAHVLADPAPVVLFMNFGDSALEFELRCWTDLTGKYMSIRSEIIVWIESALRAEGITIPFPQRDLHLASIEPKVVEHLAGAASDAPPATTPRSARAPRPAGPNPSGAGDDDGE